MILLSFIRSQIVQIPLSNHDLLILNWRMLLYHNGVSSILILLMKVSLDINVFRLSTTLAQNGLKFISEILSKKSLPNVKTPASSKLSGIVFHFAVVHRYLLSQPILRELSNNARLCSFRPPSLISASIICFLNLGGGGGGSSPKEIIYHFL